MKTESKKPEIIEHLAYFLLSAAISFYIIINGAAFFGMLCRNCSYGPETVWLTGVVLGGIFVLILAAAFIKGGRHKQQLVFMALGWLLASIVATFLSGVGFF